MGKITYKDGKLDGPYEFYDSNGKLKSIAYWKEGKEVTEPECESHAKKVASHTKKTNMKRETNVNQR